MNADSSDALPSDAIRSLLGERDRFLGFLQRRVGSRVLAEELLHDAYARALERGEQLRDDGSAVAWFFRILRNAVVERARRDAAAARALERLAQEVQVGGVGPETERAVCMCVGGVLATMKPEYQAPIRAVDLEGRRLGDFAADAGITSNNAAVRLHRGRETLRKRLRSACGTCAEDGCLDCHCLAPARR